ncbi:MAG TPA: DUF5661 family protein [Candidatus Binatia bacterium]|nr:DUF5661 family protein [Candidatus Binatia bacterium]
MKTNIFLLIAGIVIVGFTSIVIADKNYSSPAQYPKVEANFENYRAALKYAFQIDIKDFKDKLSGGMADQKPITAYDLGELLTGIKIEREHADDNFIALEIAMDHLERIPDYYSRLSRMDRQYLSDKFLGM